jgi:hypothetical protein
LDQKILFYFFNANIRLCVTGEGSRQLEIGVWDFGSMWPLIACPPIPTGMRPYMHIVTTLCMVMLLAAVVVNAQTSGEEEAIADLRGAFPVLQTLWTSSTPSCQLYGVICSTDSDPHIISMYVFPTNVLDGEWTELMS